MRRVRSAALWAALLVCLTAAWTHARAATAPADSGTFLVLLDGIPSGTEAFVIADSAGVTVARGSSSIRFGRSTLAATSRMVLNARDLTPRAFSTDVRLGGARTRTQITFTRGTSTVRTTRGSNDPITDTIACTPGCALVPDNVLYAIVLLFQRARRAGIPPGGVTIPLYPASTAQVRARGSRVDRGVPLDVYEVNLSGALQLTLGVDARERVVRMSIPLQALEVERRGVFPPPSPEAAAVPRRIARLRPIDRVPKGLVGEEVTFFSAGVTLSGTMLRPDGKRGVRYPAVLLLSGSGPQDRNGDTPGDAGVHFGLLRVIAEQLGRQGIATLRVDDRGVGASDGSFASTSLQDYVADARAAIAVLRSRKDVDPARVGIIGHSEGAMVGCLVAGDDDALRAVGLLAGFAQPFGAIIVEQTRTQLRRAGVPAAQIRRAAAEESAFVEVLRARRSWKPDDVPQSLRQMTARKRWLEDMIAFDPARAIAGVRCAAGIFQGYRDEQVAPRNAALIDSILARAGNTKRSTYTFPRLNHLFVPSSGGGYAEYTDSRRKVDVRFTRALADWARRALR